MTDAAADAALPKKADTLVLAGPNRLAHVGFAPNGELVITSERTLFRTTGGDATVVPLPERMHDASIARTADVAVLQGTTGAFYVARGTTIAPIPLVRSDGLLFAAENGRAFIAGEFVYDLTGKTLAHLSRPLGVMFAPDATWLAAYENLVPLDGSEPISMEGKGEPAGWFGTNVVYSELHDGVTVVDVATRTQTHIPTCAGMTHYADIIAKRFVVGCANAVSFVDPEHKTATLVPLPRIPPETYPGGLEPVTDSDDVFGVWSQFAFDHPAPSFRIRVNPQKRTAQFLPEADHDPPSREWDGAPPVWHGTVPSIDRSHWAKVDNGVVKVTEKTYEPTLTWGPAQASSGVKARVNGRGIDLTAYNSEVRIGPPAQPSDPIPPGMTPDSPNPSFFEVLAWSDDALVLVHSGERSRTPTQVHIAGRDGKSRGMFFFDGGCGTAFVNGTTAALTCHPREGADEVIELDTVSGLVKRRTTLADARSNDLLGVVGNDVVVQTYGDDRNSDYLRVFEAGTAHVRAEIFIWPEAAVVRFDDGAVELSGDAAFAERALRCVVDGVAKPFATCRADREVHGRFSLTR